MRSAATSKRSASLDRLVPCRAPPRVQQGRRPEKLRALRPPRPRTPAPAPSSARRPTTGRVLHKPGQDSAQCRCETSVSTTLSSVLSIGCNWSDVGTPRVLNQPKPIPVRNAANSMVPYSEFTGADIRHVACLASLHQGARPWDEMHDDNHMPTARKLRAKLSRASSRPSSPTPRTVPCGCADYSEPT